MKKILFSASIFLIGLATYCQNCVDVPYSKLLSMSKDSLIAQKFKYLPSDNLWKLAKFEPMNATANALNGIVSPLVNEYCVWIFQTKEKTPCIIAVEFYDINLFNKLLSIAKENGEMWEENDVNGVMVYRTFINGLNVTLSSNFVSQSLKGMNKSYHIFKYTVSNELESYSINEERRKTKEARRAKKTSVESLM